MADIRFNIMAKIQEKYLGGKLQKADDLESTTKMNLGLGGRAVSRKLSRIEMRKQLRSKLSVDKQQEFKDVYKKTKQEKRKKDAKDKALKLE